MLSLNFCALFSVRVRLFLKLVQIKLVYFAYKSNKRIATSRDSYNISRKFKCRTQEAQNYIVNQMNLAHKSKAPINTWSSSGHNADDSTKWANEEDNTPEYMQEGTKSKKRQWTWSIRRTNRSISKWIHRTINDNKTVHLLIYSTNTVNIDNDFTVL